jgi:hypothetical protein
MHPAQSQFDDGGVPVHQHTLEVLMQLALIAAQQLCLLPYASPSWLVRSQAGPAAAAARAAAGAAAWPEEGRDEEGGATWRSGSSGSEPRPSATAAAAAAAAAAELWHTAAGQQPLHLRLLAQLGPLFEADQQGPCLARLLQLLLHLAAATHSTQQRVAAELQQHGVHLPPASCAGSAGTSSCTSSSGGGGGGGASKPASQRHEEQQRQRLLEPDTPYNSRLWVLLLGLYHLQMLERQQQADRRTQLYQRLGIGSPHSSPQRSGWQDGGSAAGGDACADAYDSMAVRMECIAGGVRTAYEGVRHLLLYCLDSCEDAAANAAEAARRAARRAADAAAPRAGRPVRSSDSRQAPVHAPLRVCGAASSLALDGAALLRQQQLLSAHHEWLGWVAGLQAASASWPPAGAVCDFCAASEHKRPNKEAVYNVRSLPAATVACSGCSGMAWFCDECARSCEVQALHKRTCGAVAASLDARAASAHSVSCVFCSWVHPALPTACTCRGVLFGLEGLYISAGRSPLVQLAAPLPGCAAPEGGGSAGGSDATTAQWQVLPLCVQLVLDAASSRSGFLGAPRDACVRALLQCIACALQEGVAMAPAGAPAEPHDFNPFGAARTGFGGRAGASGAAAAGLGGSGRLPPPR